MHLNAISRPARLILAQSTDVMEVKNALVSELARSLLSIAPLVRELLGDKDPGSAQE